METSNEQQTRLKRLAALPDSEIDTSDIPEALDWRGAIRGWPPTRRERLAAWLDNDVIEWFERQHANERACADAISTILKRHIDGEAAKPEQK